MTLNTPKQIKTQETKEKIYKAADNILKKKGFAYLTVSNICKVAGVSNGTFFYHFKTKDDLLSYYIFDKFAEYRYRHHFDEAVQGLSFDRRIISYYCAWATYMEEIGIDFFTNFYNTSNHSLDVRRFNDRTPITMWNFPGSCLDEAEKDGLLKENVSISHAAEVLATIVKGIAFDWCLSGGAFDMEDRIEEIMHPYINSICKTVDRTE